LFVSFVGALSSKSTGKVRVKVTYVVDEYLALNVNT